MNTPVASLKNVSFAYASQAIHTNKDLVLDSVSLTVQHGEFWAILGPNGGGKTSLLKILLGLLTPIAGQIEIFGGKPQKMRHCIGYVPQFSTLQQDLPATVLDIVLMGACCTRRLGGTGRLWQTDKTARERALQALENVGLHSMEKRPVNALSGGQRQRLLVARALMGQQGNTPFLLLLDEPTANIDPHGSFCFYEFLGTLRDKITIIIVSHDLTMSGTFFSHTALVNKTLTQHPSGPLTPEHIARLYGLHAHSCPVGDLLQSAE